MKTQNETIEKFTSQDYQYGFVTDIEQDTIPPGIDENVVRFISNKKNEPDWLLNWRLKAFEHWKNMEEPQWAKVDYPKIDINQLVIILLLKINLMDQKVLMKLTRS